MSLLILQLKEIYYETNLKYFRFVLSIETIKKMNFKPVLLILLLIGTSAMLNSQILITGKIIEANGTPILGANIYLDGTYDGTSSDENGNFSFETSEEGIQTLVVSFLSFENFILTKTVSELKNLTIKLREDVNS